MTIRPDDDRTVPDEPAEPTLELDPTSEADPADVADQQTDVPYDDEDALPGDPDE